MIERHKATEVSSLSKNQTLPTYSYFADDRLIHASSIIATWHRYVTA